MGTAPLGPARPRRAAHRGGAGRSGPSSAGSSTTRSARTSPAGTRTARCRPASWPSEFGELGLLGMHLTGTAAPAPRRSPTGWPAWSWRPATPASAAWSACRVRWPCTPSGASAREEQKQRWLPGDGRRRGDRLLRPDRARPRLRPGLDDDPGPPRRRRLDPATARKMWITNAPVADVAVVWAAHRRGRRGVSSCRWTPPASRRSEIHHKLSLRASSTGEIVLDEVRLPADARAARRRSGCKAPLSCLTEARYGIVWGALGAARDCLETASAYAASADAVRPADRRLPAHPGQARRHGGGAAEGLPARAAPGPAGRRRHAARRSRSASASSTTSGRRSRSPGSAARSSARTGSAGSTRCCGTPTTWRACSPTRAPRRSTSWSSASSSPAWPPSAEAARHPFGSLAARRRTVAVPSSTEARV